MYGIIVKVDFYQLSRDPVADALAQIAPKVLATGDRLLVVSAQAEQLNVISQTLWAAKGTFAANGMAGGAHDARQPILLSEGIEAANGAQSVALADGLWREEALGFDRTFLFFDDQTVTAARETWRALKDREGIECRFWKQDGGKWNQAG